MALKLRNKQAVANYIQEETKRIEAALIFGLEYLVEKMVNHAKKSAGYEDQTSNLKSSIGGVLLKNKKPVTFRGFVNEGTATDGAQTGLEFLNSKISEMQDGYVILIVAGKEYASYVENFHELNVLKKTELKMQSEFPKMINRVRRAFKK